MKNPISNKKITLTADDGTKFIMTIDSKGKIKVVKHEQSDPYIDYSNRNTDRNYTLDKASMDMIGYFMSLGDDLLTAQDKVGQISDEIESTMFRFVKGRTQPMINKITNSNLAFMTQEAKDLLISLLTT